MNILEKAKLWQGYPFDTDTQTKVSELMKNPIELEDSFYKNLEFGTGGMRGIMGVGTNRINKYTLGKNTQGLSQYLQKTFPNTPIKVVIAYDCRHNSKSLAQTVANVFSANNIEVYIFSDLRPTPELSFAVRYLNAHCGVMLTASHNPPEYNGYKVYWQDGGQIVPPHDYNIITQIERVDFNTINFKSNPEKINLIDSEIDNAFCENSIKVSTLANTYKNNFSVVFTSLHGTAATIMPKVFEAAGYINFHSVKEQETPNGDFPTVVSPNPEDPESLEMGIEKAKELNADFVIGTDPDADRFGLAIRNLDGAFELLNGNQAMVVLTRYLLEQKKAELSSSHFIGSTIVSTPMMQELAEHYGVEYKVGLTGFKWIAKMIEDYPHQTFISGGEESFGYMVGDKVRDKDAIASALLATEIAAFQKSKGSSLYEYLIDSYVQFGLYHEELISIVKKGKKGVEEINTIMHSLRVNPPKTFEGVNVFKIDDFQKQKTFFANGTETPLSFPKSNVLRFTLDDKSQIAIRPSGTEPKIKLYFSVNTKLEKHSQYIETKKKLADYCQKLINCFDL